MCTCMLVHVCTLAWMHLRELLPRTSTDELFCIGENLQQELRLLCHKRGDIAMGQDLPQIHKMLCDSSLISQQLRQDVRPHG